LKQIERSDQKGRADIVFAVAKWFEREQKVPKIPIVLHDRAVAIDRNVGSIFGMCVHDSCPICPETDLHVHISLLSGFEFFEGSDRGLTRSRINEEDWNGICEMDLTRTCLEEFFHFWQNISYGDSYVSNVMHTATTKEEYHNNEIEIEAKSFAYAESERFLDAAYPVKEDRDFFRDVLFQIRKLERPTK